MLTEAVVTIINVRRYDGISVTETVETSTRRLDFRIIIAKNARQRGSKCLTASLSKNEKDLYIIYILLCSSIGLVV